MSRFVIVGAGAVGGVMAASLFQHSQRVLLVARGAHYEAIVKDGLRFDRPQSSEYLDVPVTDDISSIEWSSDDVIIVAVKSQHSSDLLMELSSIVPRSTPVLCAQNGVANEGMALRWFSIVYGAEISCATSYLVPGVVVAHGSPTIGAVVFGRYPRGVDDTVRELAAAFGGAEWISKSSEKIMDWKYAKLLRNMSNAVSAICGPSVRGGEIATRTRQEAELVLKTAGIIWIDDDEWRIEGEREGMARFQPVGDITVAGGSSWQSLLRGVGSVETDYLNGEIVLLGRIHGVPTPVNEVLCELANKMARENLSPGAFTETDVLSHL